MSILNNYNLKNYDCSRDGKNYPILKKPLLNLYIQTTPACNAHCYFCDTRCDSKNFNFEKLQKIVNILSEEIIIGKIAISGGEPLLVPDRVNQIIDICRGLYVTLNTNAYDLETLKKIYPRVKEVHISKHHYKNNINDEIMGIKTPTLLEIYDYGFARKTKINCVYQKGYMESELDLINMMEIMSHYGYKELRNISLLPLTNEGKEKYVDLESLMEYCNKFINDGYMYDHDMCKCFEYIYTANNGRVIKGLIRKTMNDDYSCVKQLVFDGEYLYDGFKKKNIIM